MHQPTLSLLVEKFFPKVQIQKLKLESFGIMDAGNAVNGHSKIRANGEFRRRLSPRLHSNLEVHNARDSGSAEGPSSIQRRFSPRLHKNCASTVIDSFQEPSVCGMLSPKLPQPSESNAALASPKIATHTPKVVPKDSSFQRRFSPRLHNDHGSKTQKDVCEDSGVSLGISTESPASSVNQIQRRLSPRLHQNPESKGKEGTFKESGLQRRLSPRLHSEGEMEKQQKTVSQGRSSGAKRPCGDSHAENGFSRIAKRSKHDQPEGVDCKMDSKHLQSNGTTSVANDEPLGQLTMESRVSRKEAKKDDAPDVASRSNHARVKDTLRIFNTYYLQFVQEEEERRKKNDVEKGKDGEASNAKEDAKRTSSRPDLKAISKMKEKKEVLYPEKKVGDIPGIDVGYQFFSRAEMVAIGFHSHWLNGIDYIGQSGAKRDKQQNYTFPIAVAIVMSGQYEDDLDNSEDIIYTGQGGHDLVGNKLQREDQVLLRGNLALKNNMEQSVPVRVVRGHRSANSYSGKIYSYDGLYKVAATWAEKGQRGHLVYKYRLKRLDGQPNLTSNQVQFVRGCSSKTFNELPGLVCRDISNGQEDVCIAVTNIIDQPPVGPPGFTYIKTLQVAKNVSLPSNAAGCACKGNCTNPNTCACARLNGSDFPYVRRDGGRLVEAKDIVFECGPNCGCGPGCINRISQRGIKYRLEVYRTSDKGWAVRSWDFIPSGAPVCEYIGLLRRSDELDNISGNDYIFEIDCWHTINEIEGRERRFGNVPVPAEKVLPKIDEKTLDGTPEFCIDAGSVGNVARFINHSCEPNLFVQCILSNHHDLRLARVVLFAADNIPAMQELTYDYGYALDSVMGPDGKIKVLPCFCGTSECRKRLY